MARCLRSSRPRAAMQARQPPWSPSKIPMARFQRPNWLQTPTATSSAQHTRAGRWKTARCSRSSDLGRLCKHTNQPWSPSTIPTARTPLSCLIADANGNLFGTTSAGEASGSGTVFEVTKTSSGYSSTPTTLVSFDTTNGAVSTSWLDRRRQRQSLRHNRGRAGHSETGTVFEVTGSGFVPPRQKHFAGTPGSGNCTGKSISTLAQTL